MLARVGPPVRLQLPTPRHAQCASFDAIQKVPAAKRSTSESHIASAWTAAHSCDAFQLRRVPDANVHCLPVRLAGRVVHANFGGARHLSTAAPSRWPPE